MRLTFRPIKIWPEGWPNDNGRSSPFKATYADTLDVLDRELALLGAEEAILQVDASERNGRQDGMLRADAKVNYRGVIVSFRSANFGTLTYPCDAFSAGWHGERADSWQHNLRAVALGLEALRKVERYGIANRGQQYAGYAELGTGVAIGQQMTVDEAARVLAGYGDDEQHFEENVEALLVFGPGHTDAVETLFRKAAKNLHPDSGGDASGFDRILKARELLEAQA